MTKGGPERVVTNEVENQRTAPEVVMDIINGKESGYSCWRLEGIPETSVRDLAALALFPQAEREALFYFGFEKDSPEANVCVHSLQSLGLPSQAQEQELEIYGRPSSRDDQATLERLRSELQERGLPLVIALFSQGETDDEEEFVFLFHPIGIPPLVALEAIKDSTKSFFRELEA